MISGISKVVVPVDDQAGAKEFWTGRLGFDVVSDESYGDDIEATHLELVERGLRFPVPPARMHFGWWSHFEDDDGIRYALGQWD